MKITQISKVSNNRNHPSGVSYFGLSKLVCDCDGCREARQNKLKAEHYWIDYALARASGARR